MFGVCETIVFTIPAFLWHVWKCNPKPSFRSLWLSKSEKGCPNKLQKNHEKRPAKKPRFLMKLEYFCLVFRVPFSRFFGPGSHLATIAPKSKKKVTKRLPKVIQNGPDTWSCEVTSSLNSTCGENNGNEFPNRETVYRGTRPGGMRVALWITMAMATAMSPKIQPSHQPTCGRLRRAHNTPYWNLFS